jgi:RNA polymerase sigma factor (sigma-70 family)
VDHQRLLIEHLDLIDRIVKTVGRQRHFSTIEQEDFAGYVRLQFLEDDCGILRKFRGRSSLSVYLTSVIVNLSRDFCVESWGRWRPSQAAVTLGPVAILLEQLVDRDGHPLEEAIEILRTHHDVRLGYAELHAIWAQLPVRPGMIEAGEEAAAGVPSPESAEQRVIDAARNDDIEQLDQVLAAAFAALSDQDRLILALKFDHQLTFPEIAATMNTPMTSVHRRFKRSLRDLRAALSGAGFHAPEVSGLLGHSTVALSPLLRAEVGKFSGRVRLLKRDG